MYKINLVCRACKREIDDRSFTKTKIITIEHFDKGPWIKFNDTEGTSAKTDDRFSLCQQCYKKYFKFLIEEEPEDEKHETYTIDLSHEVNSKIDRMEKRLKEEE